MRSAALLCLALLAACEQAGVQFIVEIPADHGDGPDADPQVQLPDEVRLFIGIGDENQDALGPEGFTVGEKRSGTYWLRDPSNVDPEIDRAPIGVGSPAVFSFSHTGGVDELPVVIAVGYTNGQPTSSAAIFHARVGSSRVFQYRMGLNGAADPRDRTLRGRLNQLEVWGSDECIYADNRRQDIQDTGHRVAFIVGSAKDRDCDGLLEDDPKECFPEVHLGEGLATTPTCLNRSALTEHCTVGVPRCRDTVGEDQSCNPSRFCLAQQVCSLCDANDSWACAQDFQSRVVDTSTTYGLECSFPTRLSTTAGMGVELCETPVEIEISPPAGTLCEKVGVKSRLDLAFGESFSLDGQGNTAHIRVTNNECKLKLEPRGLVIPSGGGLTSDFGALLLVALDEGRGIGAPVHVRLLAVGCSEAPSCRWIDPGAPDNPDDCVRNMQP